MASYEMKDRTALSNQETGSGGGDRDDIQLQRLGKKPVLKVWTIAEPRTGRH